MRKDLIIRADASTQNGAGHIMRCLALGQYWKAQGGQVIFITNCESDALKQRLYNEGFQINNLERSYPKPGDWEVTSAVLSKHPDAWVILDGYHFDPAYQLQVKESNHPLLVIDDMTHLDHYHADIILNQNIYAPTLKYLCDEDTVQLLGCEYVMLRQEFLEYKNWKRQISEKAKNILVTMGGGDPDNVTLKVIKALNNLGDHELEVKIVIGPANPNIETLKNALLSAPCSMRILQNVENMPELMAWADVAVSAGGSTCWEMAFMGLPALIITVADNQIEIAKELEHSGVVIGLGWYKNISIQPVTQALKAILQDQYKRSCLSERGQKLVDGEGGIKIIKAMLAGQMKPRAVQEDNCNLS